MKLAMKARRAERGFSLLEISIALALAAVIIAGISIYLQNSSRHLQLRSDAQHFSVMIQAASNYMDAHSAQLINDTEAANLGAAANTTVQIPVVPALRLQNERFLPDGVALTVGRGQAVDLRIRAIKNSATAGDWRLQALLVSSGSAATDYTDDEAGQVVSMAGAAAGFVRADDPTQIRGANGSWTHNFTAGTPPWPATPAPTPGHLAALITGGLTGTVNANVLHRVAVPGRADLNQMAAGVNIDMNQNELRNASVVGTDRIESRTATGNVEINPGGIVNINPVGAVNITPNRGNGATTIRSNGGVTVSTGGQPFEWHDGTAGSSLKLSTYGGGFVFQGLGFRMNLRDSSGNFHPFLHATPNLQGKRYDLALDSGDFTNHSDRRLKKDIMAIPDPLAQLAQLNSYYFTWKETGAHDMGVIAQEVQKVFPETVSTDDKGMLLVAYGKLVTPLIGAVKQLHQLILKLQDEFTHLLTTQTTQQTELDELKAQFKQQKLEFIQLKHAVHQPLTADERALCGAACEG